ncbi:hypothetical protein DFP72DRAFT_239953 [Ephemerocybe angulata]|uniref:F-box domain-containing protein n=1 Tax=Ephemerocybe angulata TaxID=980116 RepID=A0A8H6LUY2_9AGAR|nr:hypothetical protein DFP72DRAFT_239953 [Tulosesus angulatus]
MPARKTGRPISQLLSTNILPQPQQAAYIQTEIAKMKTQISKLRAQLGSLEERLFEHERLLSSSRKVPLEVLGEIFANAVPSVLDEGARNTLLDLCLVCKNWREAALHYPRLWSGVVLKSKQLNIATFDGDAVMLWLNRAGGVPKTLRIQASCVDGDCHKGRDSKDCQLANPALASMLAAIPNLDTLSLECYFVDCLQHLIRSMGRLKLGYTWMTLPVRSLSLKFTEQWVVSREYCGAAYTLKVPPVASLSVSLPRHFQSIQRRSKEQPIQIISPGTFKHIRTFFISTDWSLECLLETLKQCVNVETLTLDLHNGSGFTFDGPIRDSHRRSGIHLPKLRTLHLVNHATSKSWILEILRTPVLANLDISFTTNYRRPAKVRQDQLSAAEIKAWGACLKQYSKTLRTLRIHDIEVGRSCSLSNLFTAPFPSLIRLTIDRVEKDSLFFYNLRTPPKKNGRWFPRLETLEVLEAPANFDAEGPISFVAGKTTDRVLKNGWYVDKCNPPRVRTVKSILVTYHRDPALKGGVCKEQPKQTEDAAAEFRKGGTVVTIGPRFVAPEIKVKKKSRGCCSDCSDSDCSNIPSD